MDFYTQPSFFVLLAISFIPAAYLGLTGKRIKYYGFGVSCLFLFFLFSGNLTEGLYFGVFLVTSGVSFKIVLSSWQSGEKSMAKYRFALVLSLLPLLVCKLSALFDANILGFLGLSYLTFRTLQVVIEIRDGIISDMKLLDYYYFITFFATVTSGPIDRSTRFVNDLDKVYKREEYADMLSKGLLYLAVGGVYYFVLAGIVLPYYSPSAFSSETSFFYNVAAAVKDAYAYGFYLFFNFAGYSLMAVGASYCFGIATPMNFKAPFIAKDMKEFWNRWHISLSYWLRDFVFMRFSRYALKKKLFSDRLQTACIAYMLNMIIMGLWHGLTIDYLMYGIYQGLALALTEAIQKKSKFYKKHKNKTWFKIVSWGITINVIMFGFALFSGQVHLIVGGLIYG